MATGGYIDDLGNYISPDMYEPSISSDEINYDIDNSNEINYDTNNKSLRLERAAELKRKRMYRKGDLKYDSDGQLIHDSNTMIRAKEVANAGIRGVDWLLEASENIVDFGQGDAIGHYTGFKAENQGREYSMDNKDFVAARDTTTDQLIKDYHNAEHNPNADKGIYTLKKFDGYNEDGSEKFIYKYGLADVSADTRYRDQYVRDGFEIVEEKRFAGAEDWEKTWNASQGVLNERTLDNSFGLVAGSDGTMMTRDEASGIEFGSGKTELLNKDLLGTDVDKTQKDYDVNKKYSEALSTARDEEGYHDNSIVGRGLNAAAGAASMLTKVAVVDTVDWIGEITGIGDLADSETKRKWTQNLFGYDDHFSKENMAEIEGHVNNMMEHGLSWKGIKGALGAAIANVETTGESLGYLVGLFAGVGKFTKVGKLTKAVNEAKILGATKQAITFENQIKNASLAEKAIFRIGEQAGLLNATTSMTNDQIDDFKKNNNGVGPSGGHLTFMFANNLVALATDRFTDMSVLQSAGLLKASGLIKTAKESIKSIGRDGLPDIANKIIATTSSLVASMGTEFAQEYYQTMSEQVNKQWKTDKYGDNLMKVLTSDKNILESLVGGVAGAGGAVHFQMAGSAPGIARDVWQKGYDKATEKSWEKAMENVSNISDIDKEEDLTSGTINNAIIREIVGGGKLKVKDFNIDNTESFKKTLDIAIRQRLKNAPNKEDSREIIQNQMSIEIFEKVLEHGYAELKKGNKIPLENALSLIKKANDDQDINFKTSDIQEKVNNDYAEKLSEILVKEYSLSGISKDLEIDLDSTEGIEKAKAEKKKLQDADLDSLMKEIEQEQLQESMLKQGAMLNFGNNDTVEVDDAVLGYESDLSLGKLKELITKYRANDNIKNHKDVMDEIKKFGFIEETNKKYNKKTGEKKGELKLKPSMNSYDRVLDSEFSSLNKIKNVLNKTVKARKGPTLDKFVNWSKSRFEKNKPKIKNVPGEEPIIAPSNRTARNLVEMVKENKWFEKKIIKLKKLLETHEIGKDKLPEAEKENIKEQLAIAEENMIASKAQIQKHQNNIEEFLSSELGLDGFDWNNKDHVSAAIGIFTVLDFENGVEVFKQPKVNIMSAEKYNTLEKTYGSKQQRLIDAGMTINKSFVDYRSDSTTGSEKVSSTEPVIEKTIEKSKVVDDKVVEAQNYITEMTNIINEYKKVSLDDVQMFMNKVEKILTEIDSIDKEIVGKNFVVVAGKLLDSINKD
ncbi:MAG: hypothetical protein J7L15_05135, partial [Clostridiales bacterium]|nr:hypothetical protein [Clostridiales bacterium]